ncbi:hypothetical protein ACS0TY_004169 [Phlomoides rotata]
MIASTGKRHRSPPVQAGREGRKEQEEKNDKWHRVERSSGKFLRRFRLPENAKLDEVKAAMENGVLTVTVPKEKVKKPEVKAIDISGPGAAMLHTDLDEIKGVGATTCNDGGNSSFYKF